MPAKRSGAGGKAGGPAVVGVDLGGTNVRAGLVKDGKLIRVVAAKIDARATVDGVLERIYSVVEPIVVDPGTNVAAIGAGVPSVLDVERGVIYDVQNIPSWKAVPLKARLEGRFGLPVTVNNDANCFALAEWRFGRARGRRHAVGLIIGTGLGAGIIADGRLVSGAHCGAGEFGMLPYLDRNFEYYACGQFFEHVHGTTGEDAARRAARGDRAARRMFAEYGAHLGEAVKAVCYACDPEIIVLGGSVSRSYRWFAPALRARFRTFVYAPIVRDLEIAVSALTEPGVLGAAGLSLAALES
jgi:glucokinase